jgi:serine/threonine protein kinase
LYKIQNLLGLGAFGIVLDVVSMKTKETSALKVISQDNKKALLQTDLTEQQVLDGVKHENIIFFKRILYSNNHVFIEMEKINGGTLESFIKSKKRETRCFS